MTVGHADCLVLAEPYLVVIRNLLMWPTTVQNPYFLDLLLTTRSLSLNIRPHLAHNVKKILIEVAVTLPQYISSELQSTSGWNRSPLTTSLASSDISNFIEISHIMKSLYELPLIIPILNNKMKVLDKINSLIHVDCLIDNTFILRDSYWISTPKKIGKT